MSGLHRFRNLAILALAFRTASLAESSGTIFLSANMTLNLDTAKTGTSGGDLLWNGSTLTLQGSATAAVVPGISGETGFGGVTETSLMQSSSLFSNAPINAPAVGAVIGVHTNGGNYAKLIVTEYSEGEIWFGFVSYGGPLPPPYITAVENAASNIPPPLPNSGIAQGSMFVVKGFSLGPTTFIQASTFPLPTSLGGTSIAVTVGGTTVNAILFYVASSPGASQVAAILPSKIPTGTGTLKLTYNNQSGTAPITVVENNIGIYTVSTTGTGDAVAFLNSDSQLITSTHAANDGDVVVFWGTGLGAVTFDETQPAIQADMLNVPLQVYIGGQQAQINFRGRNGCCSSVDTVYVTVPPGVSGCKVSVLMQIGSTVSNATSIAVAQNGRTCTPVNPSPILPTIMTGRYRVGNLSLQRSVQTGEVSSQADLAEGTFEKVTWAVPPTGSQVDINSYGSCSVSNFTPGLPPSPAFGSVDLDAGPSIALTGPFGNRTITKSTDAGYTSYDVTLDQAATTLTPGQYTFTGTGGADVGPFAATYKPPTFFVWTDQATISMVNRAKGVTVHWAGGNPAGYVTIGGLVQTRSPSVSTSFTCTARVSDQSFFVPPIVLLGLPPSGPGIAGGPVSPGPLWVETSDYQPFDPPQGLDGALVGISFFYETLVTYQ